MKRQERDSSLDWNIEQIELKGFSRSLTEIEFLLLILVILYYVVPGTAIDHPFLMTISMLTYAVFVLGFNYVNLDTPQYSWKLAIETWVMIIFITWVLWNTGNIASPLLNLYLLVIISSAIALDKITTMLEIVLIFAFYVFLAFKNGMTSDITGFSQLMIYFSPFVLVAYITTMLASDVHYGKMMFKALSETDEMTNLLNKRSFIPMFNKAAEVAMKYNQPLSVLMIDADNLKEVNDKHGHKAGDKLIITMALTIEDCLRTSDIICRFGGDEFVALLPQLPRKRAKEAAERLRSAIQNTSFDVDGKAVSSTVSIGIATYPDEVGIVYELLDKADEALYECKRSGRNSVVNYGDVKSSSTVEHIQGEQKFEIKLGRSRKSDMSAE
jgi:diguanylate cyclase (GGDEF)-like protein